jgi:hypothetical protein
MRFGARLYPELSFERRDERVDARGDVEPGECPVWSWSPTRSSAKNHARDGPPGIGDEAMGGFRPDEAEDSRQDRIPILVVRPCEPILWDVRS